jgi:hypothetical protein
MSILNVNQIQPVGGGNTITVTASDVSASGATITASSFVGNITGNITSSSTSTFSSLEIKNGTDSGFSGAQLKIGDNVDTGIQINQSADTIGGPRLVFGKSRGTLDTPTTLLTDDQLFTARGYGYVGSTGGWVHGGYYGLHADGTVSDTSTGFGARFSVHLRNSGGYIRERLRITSTGNVGIGTDTPYTNNSFNSLSIGGSGKY